MGTGLVEERRTTMISKAHDITRFTFKQALETILSHVQVLNQVELTLSKSLGHVTSEDVCSDIDLPMSDLSGPDGYAVRSSDITHASHTRPVTLNIIETVRAGYLPHLQVTPGTAIRIMTGSVIPRGADCVVRFEDTDEPKNKNGPNPNEPKKVKIYIPETPGSNIRKAGYQIQKGMVVLPRESIIGPTQISALAAIGKLRIKVIRKPAVAVIPTGDELVRLGRPLMPGKVYDCNALALKSLITYYGGIPKMLGIARDTEDSLVAKILKGLEADAIITCGGVSRGDYDLVRLVLGKVGKVVFSRIKMGPGASFAFGLANKAPRNGNYHPIPIFALSGPPNGCVINFETLVRPALLKMRGLKSLEHPVVEAVAEHSVSGQKPMILVRWTDLEKAGKEYRVKLNNAEGLLASIATANSLTLIPEKAEIKAGDRISVWPFSWSQSI